MQRVVVTGIGLRTSLGNTVDAFFRNLINGVSGLRQHPTLALHYDVGHVEFDADAHFTRLQQKFMDRVSQLAVVAAQDAAVSAGLDCSWGEDAGVYIGTSLGGLTSVEDHYERFFSQRRAHLMIPGAMVSGPSAHIAIQLGITGESQTYSSACASSTIALGEAFLRIQTGRVQRALAGGAESALLPGIVAAWDAMGVMYPPDPLTPGTGCRPFSADRRGFALGEGAAMFVLESLSSAQARGATPLCEITGYGLSCDATHIINPSAKGQVQAMRRALACARLQPEDIGYINAHGTGTPGGDAAEAASISEVFGSTRQHMPPVSSTKSAHGHLLGATGAVEFAATAMALNEQILPPTTHWTSIDPAVPFDCIPGRGRPVEEPLEHAMSNSFGFGGNNAVLVARRWPAHTLDALVRRAM